MKKNRLILYLPIVASFITSGCKPDQILITDKPESVKTATATVRPTTTPKPSSTHTRTPSPFPTTTPTKTATSTVTPTTDDGKYRPPQLNYACDFPYEITRGPGFKLREYYLDESFETILMDDFGSWYSIEFLRILDENLPIPEAFEERKRYLDFDLNYLMDRRIKPEVPQGAIIEQEYIQSDSPILMAVLDLPGGSNMLVNGVPADATRAVYIVIHGAYSYVISTQFSDLFPREKTQEEIIQTIKKDLKKFYASCEFEANPDVGKDFVYPTITPIPDPIDFIPDMNIPEELFSFYDGADNMETWVIAAKGDWVLVGDYQAIFPVPAGWTTEVYTNTIIKFSSDGDLDNPQILLRLGGVGYIGDDNSSAAVMEEFENELKTMPSAIVFENKIIDDSKGYIFLSLTTEAGLERYLLVVFSEDEQGFYQCFFIYADPEEWDAYYPIIRAIIQNWADLELRPLGMLLPEKISLENGQSLYVTPYPQGTWERVPDDQVVYPTYSIRVNTMAVDSQGRLWAGTTEGLGLFGSDGEWTTYTPEDPNSPLSIWNISIDDQDRIWLGNDGAIWMFDPSTSTWTKKFEDLKGNFLAVDSQYLVWMHTSNGAYVVHPNGQETHYTVDNSGLMYGRITAFAQDAQGNIWLGNYEALSKLEPNGDWTTYETGIDLPEGMVSSLSIDDKGRVWVGISLSFIGTGGGLSVLENNGQWTTHAPPASVNAVAVDDQDRVWVGTGTGIKMLAPDGEWTDFTPENSGIAPGRVNAIAVGPGGDVWADTIWLNQLKPDGTWQFYIPAISDNSYFYDDWSDNQIFDQQDRLWVGTDVGLYVLSPDGQWTTYTIENSPLLDNSILGLAIDSQGQIWVGTFYEGVHSISPEGEWETYTAAEMKLGNEFIEAFAVDQQDILWVGTSGNLLMFDPDSGWKSFKITGLDIEIRSIMSLAVDTQDRLWAKLWTDDQTELFAIFTPP